MLSRYFITNHAKLFRKNQVPPLFRPKSFFFGSPKIGNRLLPAEKNSLFEFVGIERHKFGKHEQPVLSHEFSVEIDFAATVFFRHDKN